MNIKQLGRRFPHSKIRQKTGHYGQQLSYVEWAEVVKRINRVFEGRWSFDIVEWQQQNQTLVVLARLTTDGVSKMQFGSCSLDDALPFGDALKAATSDALKRCSALLGVGLHLYATDAPKPIQTSTAPSSVRQRGLIEALAKENQWSADKLKRHCMKTYAHPLVALDKRQASDLIDYLRQLEQESQVAI